MNFKPANIECQMSDEKDPLSKKILNNICLSERTVFTPADFSAMGSCEAVEHALKKLINDKEMVSIGSGVITRARRNRITGEIMLAAPGGFQQVALEALDLLEVTWSPCVADLQYKAGGKQLPIQTTVRVVGNYKPELSFRRYKVRYEE